MYCTACGTYSSGAGAHTCAEPETSATPVATATATAPAPAIAMAPATTSTAPPAGWHPDPHDPTLVRYWDGAAWTDHTAWAATGPATPANGSAAAAPGAVLGAALATEHGRYLGALPRTVGRKGRFDVLVYEHALVFARVPGMDPAAIGFLVGILTGSWVIGYVAGDYIGASRNDERIAGLTRMTPSEIAARDERNAVVPFASLRGGQAVTYGRSGGRMKVQTTDGTTWKRRWTRPHTRHMDADALVQSTLGYRVPVRRGSPVRPYVPAIVVTTLVAAFVLGAIVLPVILGARDRAQERAALSDLRLPCQSMLRLNDRAATGEQINPQELVFAVGNLVVPMRKAGDEIAELAPAADSAQRLDGFLSSWDGASPPPDTFEADLGAIVGACMATQ